MPHRYLVSFDTDTLPQRFTDVLVLGSGIAGLSVALEAASRGVRVLVCTKASTTDCATAHAQGGIAASLPSEQGIESHVQDTLVAGAGLCNEDLVRLGVSRSAAAIERLVSWGAQFDRNASGALALTREGGHSEPRILHANGDQTGAELERALAHATQGARIEVLEQSFLLDLLTTADGVCRGALVNHAVHGRLVIWAHSTVLATGGAGRLYRETTNPTAATGDGVASAGRAGATLKDLEFYQFHPTTLYVAGASRALISEAVRGEGAVLVDRNGIPFMKDVHPLGDLAPRDIVARAIVRRMRETDDNRVYLDATKLGRDFFAKRFPHITSLCDTFAIDMASDVIPVRPTAHYMIGGVAVDATCHTSIEGLLACGETACSGFHGANRLGSNSLLEGAVFGEIAGQEAASRAKGMDRWRGSLTYERTHARSPIALDVDDLRRSLRAANWYQVGVERDAAGLASGLKQLGGWLRYALEVEFTDTRGWELQNMLMVSVVMATLAAAREESRGCHHRMDFPQPKDQTWLRHSLLDARGFVDLITPYAQPGGA